MTQDRDLYCSAAGEVDKTVVGVLGHRRIAPASRPICRRCDLPDTDSICSHLVHPSVTALKPVGPAWERFVWEALCERDRAEIAEPGGCRAGGHGCWERIIAAVEASATPVHSALSLPEQFDFLDAVWRGAFKRSLLQLRVAGHVAGLALGCASREEFSARLSDLADVLTSLHVPADLLPMGKAGVRGPLKRVELALEAAGLDTEAMDRATTAIGILQDLVRLRVGLQHGDAARELPDLLARLQIPYPPTDWETTWNRVRARANDSLALLRNEVRHVPDLVVQS